METIASQIRMPNETIRAIRDIRSYFFFNHESHELTRMTDVGWTSRLSFVKMHALQNSRHVAATVLF